MGSHGGGEGDIVEVIHLIFGVLMIVSMSGSPMPLSSLGEMRVVCLMAKTLPCLKKFIVADVSALICGAVGEWNWAWYVMREMAFDCMIVFFPWKERYLCPHEL